jgi:hypothetical protein
MPGNTFTVSKVKVPRRPFEIMGLTFVLMTITFLLSFVSPSSSTVAVPQRTDGGTTLEVSVPTDRSVSGSSVNFDLSASIKRPTTWTDSQYVAVEVALTTAGSDSASVFRGSGGCVVDLSSSANTATYSTTQGDGLVSITGVTNQIFVMNDQSPQLSLQGRLDDVLTALQKVQVRCNAQSDLVSKYVRLGAVPSIFQDTSGCTASAAIYPCNGPLLYLFSTQHYYQLRYHNHSTSGDGQIAVLFNDAKTRSIDVDGSARSGATARYGWVATLSEQDEIRLTNALNQPAVSMIGTTDSTATWNWDATAWGSSTGNTAFANSGTNCATNESDFRWIGPDVWCLRVPAKNQVSGQRYWARNASNQWVPQATSTGALIDFDSATNSSNGFNLYHAWGSSGNITEPNASGDFIYQASSVATWDDTNAPGPWKNYFIEYCDPNNTCAPPSEAVASIQLKLTQTITFTGAASSYSTETVDLTAATTTSGLTISYASSDTAICTVNSSAVVTLLSRGICAITASQAGNSDYLAAADVTQTFTSNFGTAASGLITSCDGIGALGNGGFENLPEVTENEDDDGFTGEGRWHGYNAGTNNQPRFYLFLNPAGSDQFPLESWQVTTNNRIEIQRAVEGFELTDDWQPPDIFGVNPSEGLYFAELNADVSGTLYQDIATIPGTTLRWSLDHRGRRPGTTVDTMNLRIGPADGTLVAQEPTTRPANSGSGVSMSDGRGSTATQTTGGAAGGWGTYRGVYTVPAEQTTTRFSFESTDAGSGGNLLDNIIFTPTIACPDTTTIVSGRSAVNFNAVTNDYFPTNSTVSVVSITGSGSATVSGTNLSLSSSSSGSYAVRYRITNPDGDTSDSTVTVTVLSESTPRLPDVLLVDPRTDRVDFPQALFENATNLLVCVQESDSGGAILDFPTVRFDVASKEEPDITGFGSATINGDRTSALLIRHTRQNVLDTFNSLGGLRAYLSNGNFTSTKYVRVRTVPVAASTTAVTSETCADASSSASKTIEIRPLGLTKTLRKGTIQLK